MTGIVDIIQLMRILPIYLRCIIRDILNEGLYELCVKSLSDFIF